MKRSFTQVIALTLLLLVMCAPSLTAVAEGTDYFAMSLDELLEIDVALLARKPQRLFESPAAITVLTSEDIRRSGLTSIPELLRLVPGLEVARITSSTWAITSRGFNSLYANKLLVLMDGRTLYNPFFSGTFWEVQDTVLADIDRIEVIRGPGASLWGANAVNGIINIVTKPADQTQGTLVELQGGRPDRTIASARYGGNLGSAGHVRIYAKQFDRAPGAPAPGFPAADDQEQGRIGFRADLETSRRDRLTLQGEYYTGEAHNPTTQFSTTPPFLPVVFVNTLDNSGNHLLGRWERDLDQHGTLELRVYYDSTRVSDAYELRNDILDADFQHRWSPSDRHELIWGFGFRHNRNRLDGSKIGFNGFTDRRNDDTYSAFLQDEITLVPERWRLALGSKFEHNDYSGLEVQPSARLSWTPSDRQTFWAAVTHAVRTPARFESEAVLGPFTIPTTPPAPPLQFQLLGSEELDAETSLACELGWRRKIRPGLTAELALFHNRYDDLINTTQVFNPSGFDIVYDNVDSGHSFGGELEVRWQPLENWQLNTSYSYLKLDLDNPPAGFSGGLSSNVADASPRHQVKLVSHIDLPREVEIDTLLLYVDDILSGAVDGYLRLDLRLAWHPRPDLELSLALQNLLDDRHPEFVDTTGSTQASEVERGLVAGVRWQF